MLVISKDLLWDSTVLFWKTPKVYLQMMTFPNINKMAIFRYFMYRKYPYVYQGPGPSGTPLQLMPYPYSISLTCH